MYALRGQLLVTVQDLVDTLVRDRDLPDDALLPLLAVPPQDGSQDGPQDGAQGVPHEDPLDAALFAAADAVRRQVYGDAVYLRGLIEFTNYCKNNCYYCGIRAGNGALTRYRLDADAILACCEEGYALGFRTFVLQGGEDPYYTDEKICAIVSRIRARFPDCAITLSLGERERESFAAFYRAGANRYLLRHETADDGHYRSLHPQSMDPEHRKQCLFWLKEIGYQVGSGFMVGSPYQKPENLLADLRFLQRLQPDMIGIGPYIPHAQTPFAQQPRGSLALTLRLIAILRLLFPHALIPATTALGTIHPMGRELGLRAGANVVMPNLSPVSVRAMYALYDHKICTGEEAAECRSCLERRVENAGYRVVTAVGDVKRDGGRKALVAMSGGVDSSVAAFLMREAGCACIGVTMKLFRDTHDDLPDGDASGDDTSGGDAHTCCSLADVEDARSVAHRLGIPYYVFNFADRFGEAVIDRFVDAYRHGRTPNPCIDCNRYLKFETLFRRARELGCDCIATGHYARVCYDAATGRYLLKKALDPEKDQSYVLYSLTQEQLRYVRFPLGTMTKAAVRRIAEEQGFVNAKKQDSQDICFVQGESYADFIERYTGTPCPPGDFIGTDGAVLGRHRGIIRYTVGQRKGLGMSFAQPMYVANVDPVRNTVTVAPDGALYARGLSAEDINLISVERLTGPMRVRARVRYHQPEQWATVTQPAADRLEIIFDEPQRAITKGQSVVLYDGDTVVGGGTIAEVYLRKEDV